MRLTQITSDKLQITHFPHYSHFIRCRKILRARQRGKTEPKEKHNNHRSQFIQNKTMKMCTISDIDMAFKLVSNNNDNRSRHNASAKCRISNPIEYYGFHSGIVKLHVCHLKCFESIQWMERLFVILFETYKLRHVECNRNAIDQLLLMLLLLRSKITFTK